MTWVDEHGIVHLARALPQPVWEGRNAWQPHTFGLVEMELGPDTVIIGEAAKGRPVEYPKFQTYCGVGVYVPSECSDATTCVECINTERLVGEILPEGYPWWR
jgi:hypothetical protein